MRLRRTIKWPLTSAIALLILTSASLAEAQILQTLCSFAGTNGANPQAALTLGSDGNFYGTTYVGGSSDEGTVFKVTTNGTLTTLVSFSGTNGAYTEAALTLGSDGNFYGTTHVGGSAWGTIFKITTSSAFTTLVSFSATNGAYPQAALTLGNDGNFYGTTTGGGSVGYYGTVFKVTTSGTLTKLVSLNNTNGASPMAALTLGSDGNFFGTTYGGGSSSNGTVFKVTTSGILTTLVSFSGTNGAYPQAALTLGHDGNFYGTTPWGGNNDEGTVFKVTTSGTLTTLYSFTGGPDGANPYGAMTLGNDGNFYGTTTGGGRGYGTVFKVTTNGMLTTLVAFNSNNGAIPVGGLTLGNDGNFYGTTGDGGSGGYGTVFCLLLPPTITQQPQSQTNGAGESVAFLVSATSLTPMRYQWQKNGTNLVDGGNVSGTITDVLSITSISDGDAGTYSVVLTNSGGGVMSSNAVLTVNDCLFIASQPQSQTVGLGSNVTFNATVYGAPPFVFQWHFNDTPVGSPSTGTNVSYTLTNVETNQSGNYSVFVVNGYGGLMSSNAVLTVKVFPPSIGLQPSSQSVMIGSSALFSVSVSGTPPFQYQWQFNGTNLLNATNAAYANQSVGATDTGNYSVIVTNLAGTVASSNALLTVIVPPTLALDFLAGYPLLNLNGMLSSNFVVQYSTNLTSTNWSRLLSLTNLSSSPYLFLDPAGDAEPARFYRAFMQ
jgi:uncharacterized repeat protein (TIGR03803 family)